jgi:hypothetical protein
VKLAVAILSATLCFVAQAQENGIKEPEFANTFMALDGDNLLPLEHQAASIHGHSAFVTAHADFEIEGGKSPLRLHGGELNFVVKAPFPNSADPSTMYILRKLESSKKNRKLTVVKSYITPFSSGTKSNLWAGDAQLKFTPYGKESIKITAQLQPGEYALTLFSGPNLYCFGVD